MAKQKIADVEGIGPAIGEKLRACGIADIDALLEASGVDRVPELAQRNPAELARKMAGC
jgi:hypothetical protein